MNNRKGEGTTEVEKGSTSSLFAKRVEIQLIDFDYYIVSDADVGAWSVEFTTRFIDDQERVVEQAFRRSDYANGGAWIAAVTNYLREDLGLGASELTKELGAIAAAINCDSETAGLLRRGADRFRDERLKSTETLRAISDFKAAAAQLKQLDAELELLEASAAASE